MNRLPPIRIGLVGCGAISTQHLEAISGLEGLQLVGVVSASADRARTVGERWDVPWTIRLEELLARDDVDAVTIATPSGLHAGQALAALRSGRHVVVEKPIALTVADADEIIREGHQRGLTVATISQRRFEPAVRGLHAAVQAGALGRISLIIAEGLYHRPQSYYDSAAWRGTRALDGGVLMNQAIHVIDLLRWLGGPPASVSAHLATIGHAMEAEDTASVSLRFAGGALGEIVATTCLASEQPTQLRVYGDLGHVRLVGDTATEWDVPGSPPHPGTATRSRRRPPPLGARPGAPTRPATSASTRTSSTPCARAVPGRHRRGWTQRHRDHRRRVRGGSGRSGRHVRRSAGVRIGAAKVDITPPLGMQLEGFEVRVDGATGIHDPLFARALVAEGADGTTVALVVADLIQVDPRLQGLVADEVLALTGIPRERLQLVGTHTHSGPRLSAPSETERTIGHRISGAVAQAWRERREAVVAVGIGRVTGIAGNRRPNGGPVDDRVIVTRIDGTDGEPIATHASYGCHPTTLGPNNLLYTADYPGVLCGLVDEAVGGVTMFSTGPQGDVNPGGYSPEGSMVGVVVPWRTFESAQRYGEILAECVLGVRAGLVPAPSDRAWGDARVVELRRKWLPEAGAARELAALARATAERVAEVHPSADAVYHAAVAAAYTELLADQAEDPGRDGPVGVRASALAIGPLLHIGVSGELFVGLGMQIKSALGDDRTCVAALCDGTVGYLPTAEAYEVGGYEPNASVLAAGEGERLVDAVVALALTAPEA